jgi:phasin family protein
MAENADKPSESAEKAYAAASAAVPATAEPAKPVVSRKAATPAPKKPLPTATKAAPTTPTPTITELKDKIMATAKSTDFSKTVTDTVGEFQRRAKEAYDKGAELSAEATEFAKGNVEALVESGKILAAGVQDLGKTYAEDAKSAYETATADLKEFAAVKSPTELFQLQGRLLRRNFETLFAYGSKNTEAVVKLASESFAPLSGRASLAAEKLSKVA